MPTYEYRCPDGHAFEVFQKMSDDPVARCPQCNATAERLISGGAGFLFRGDGFYITDYRSEDYKKKASKEATSIESGGSGSGSSGNDGASSQPAAASSSGPSGSGGGTTDG